MHSGRPGPRPAAPTGAADREWHRGRAPADGLTGVGRRAARARGSALRDHDEIRPGATRLDAAHHEDLVPDLEIVDRGLAAVASDLRLRPEIDRDRAGTALGDRQ